MIQSRIREIRKEKGLTLQEVAKKAGTTAQTIGRLETGTRTLSIAWVNRISKALGVDSANLLALPNESDLEISGGVAEGGNVLPEARGTVSFRFLAKKPTAFKVVENLGEFRKGDILIFDEAPGQTKASLGKECLIELNSKKRIVARLLTLDKKGKATFNLLGPKPAILEGQSIKSALPLVGFVRHFN